MSLNFPLALRLNFFDMAPHPDLDPCIPLDVIFFLNFSLALTSNFFDMAPHPDLDPCIPLDVFFFDFSNSPAFPRVLSLRYPLNSLTGNRAWSSGCTGF